MLGSEGHHTQKNTHHTEGIGMSLLAAGAAGGNGGLQQNNIRSLQMNIKSEKQVKNMDKLLSLMKNNVTFLKKGKNSIAVIQDKHASGQGEHMSRSAKPKDPALGTSATTAHTPVPNDYESHKGSARLDNQAVPRHASTESQHRAIMLSQQQQQQQNAGQQPKNVNEQKIKQIIRIQQTSGRNLLNMSQQLNNSKKLNLNQIRFHKDGQKVAANNNSALSGAIDQQKGVVQMSSSNNPVINFNRLKMSSDVAQQAKGNNFRKS